MDTEYIKIGKYIRSRRELLGLSQQEVADKVGVSKSGVSRWESGETANIGRDKIQLLAEALKVSPLAIIFGEDVAEDKKTDEDNVPASVLTDYFYSNKKKLSDLEYDKQQKLIKLIDLYLE